VSSVRDSDRIIGLLDSKTLRAEHGQRMEKQLLLTRFDAARASRGEMLSVADVLDILSIPLLGIIPESEDILRASNLGAPITMNGSTSQASRSYEDAARRLVGESVPMLIPGEKKSLFNRILGRRAA
jgi:septum site-determining protein MinD